MIMIAPHFFSVRIKWEGLGENLGYNEKINKKLLAAFCYGNVLVIWVNYMSSFVTCLGVVYLCASKDKKTTAREVKAQMMSKDLVLDLTHYSLHRPMTTALCTSKESTVSANICRMCRFYQGETFKGNTFLHMYFDHNVNC